MAVTKIWPVKDSIKRVVDYAENPDKTEFSDIQTVLHYAENGEKTVSGEEKTMYVTGINCSRDTAFQEMIAVQERFDKTTGNVAYHAYQSFKTGEVTPELCHQLGVELAQKMWGDQYQVLVASHFNTGTYHNHFVVNAVGMWDGKKFNCNMGAYWKFRNLSDELCREHGLTVIQNPTGKTARSIYFAEKNGDPTRYNLMRDAIDFAISVSIGKDMFIKVMRDQGYVIEVGRKYPTIRSVHSRKAVRMWRLGENYDLEAVWDRMRSLRSPEKFWRANDYRDERSAARKAPRRRYSVRGPVRGYLTIAKKSSGVYGLYLHYCYLLGVIPKHKKRRPLSPELREAWRQIDQISEEVQLAGREKFHSQDDVIHYMEIVEQQFREVERYREKLRNRLRRCTDPEQISALKAKRNDCTETLKNMRTDIKAARRILERTPRIRREITIEERMKHELFPTPKIRRSRKYER